MMTAFEKFNKCLELSVLLEEMEQESIRKRKYINAKAVGTISKHKMVEIVGEDNGVPLVKQI